MKLKVGETLILEQETNANKVLRSRCKLAEVHDETLLVDYPIAEDTGKTVILDKGAALVAVYVMNNQVFRFPMTFVERIAGHVPLLKMSYGGDSSLVSIQRRNYVRVKTNIDIAIHSENGLFPPFVTVTSDISGGGALINLPDDVDIPEGEQVVAWMVLPMGSGTYHYMKLRSKIVRVFTDRHTHGKRATIEFLSPSDRDKQIILRFSFDVQLEMRKKLLAMEERRRLNGINRDKERL